MVTADDGSTKTKCSNTLPVDHALSGLVVIAFVCANRPEGLRTQDSIDCTTIVPGASQPTLNLYDQLHIAVSIVVVTVIIVRVVRIGIRIEDWESKRVDEDEPSVTEMAEMMYVRHCP